MPCFKFIFLFTLMPTPTPVPSCAACQCIDASAYGACASGMALHTALLLANAWLLLHEAPYHPLPLTGHLCPHFLLISIFVLMRAFIVVIPRHSPRRKSDLMLQQNTTQHTTDIPCWTSITFPDRNPCLGSENIEEGVKCGHPSFYHSLQKEGGDSLYSCQ